MQIQFFSKIPWNTTTVFQLANIIVVTVKKNICIDQVQGRVCRMLPKHRLIQQTVYLHKCSQKKKEGKKPLCKYKFKRYGKWR